MGHRIQQTLWEEADGPLEPQRTFRPIHYLGSKLRLLDEITDAVDSVDPSGGPACDLFAGTGTVARTLAQSRSVTAVDIQEYSRVLCSALLRPDQAPRPMLLAAAAGAASALDTPLARAIEPLIEHEEECIKAAVNGRVDQLCDVLDYGSIYAFGVRAGAPVASRALSRAMSAARRRLSAAKLGTSVGSLLTTYYGGIYFSYRQAVALDTLLEVAESASDINRDTLLALAMSCASDVVNTVGKHFAQPVRLRTRAGSAKLHLVSKVKRDRELNVGDRASEWVERYADMRPPVLAQRAVREDYASFLRAHGEPLSVVYADPPYTRDHYSRYYHILETMARRDAPALSVSNLDRSQPSRGLYRSERHQSPFCIKSQAPGAFAELFDLARRQNVPLVLSYSPYDKAAGAHPRLVTVDQLVRAAKASFKHVELRSLGTFSHSKLNSSRHALEASAEAEVLLLCSPSKSLGG